MRGLGGGECGAWTDVRVMVMVMVIFSALVRSHQSTSPVVRAGRGVNIGRQLPAALPRFRRFVDPWRIPCPTNREPQRTNKEAEPTGDGCGRWLPLRVLLLPRSPKVPLPYLPHVPTPLRTTLTTVPGSQKLSLRAGTRERRSLASHRPPAPGYTPFRARAQNDD